MNRNLFADKKFYLILLWLVFTTVFAVWWMILGLRHVEMLADLVPAQEAQWMAQKRMLFWEGISWITLLVIGGLSSLYLLMREKKHVENLKTFFASFNHDVKTSLASLRLQAESIKEDLEEGGTSSPLLGRLISDTMRLQVQLENSLFMSSKDAQKLLLEKISFSQVVEAAKVRWPQIQISINKEALVFADERALTTVINNLIQNSLVHGEAQKIFFEVKAKGSSEVEILFYDDGHGFKGDAAKLGQLFFRSTTKSGTGLGLYICHELFRQMGGQFLLSPSARAGFSGAFVLRGAIR